MEDHEIIRRYISGQKQMLDLLIDRYKNPLYKLCYHLSLSRMDGDDLFQDTWVKAIKNIEHYDLEKSFLPWLYRIAANLYKDKYRAKKRWLNRIKEYFTNEQKELELEGAESSVLLPEDEIIERADQEAIRRCINNLDDIYRLPILLYYFKEINYGDIAAILDIPIGTVKSRLNTGKKKLRKLMEVEEVE